LKGGGRLEKHEKILLQRGGIDGFVLNYYALPKPKSEGSGKKTENDFGKKGGALRAFLHFWGWTKKNSSN